MQEDGNMFYAKSQWYATAYIWWLLFTTLHYVRERRFCTSKNAEGVDSPDTNYIMIFGLKITLGKLVEITGWYRCYDS